MTTGHRRLAPPAPVPCDDSSLPQRPPAAPKVTAGQMLANAIVFFAVMIGVLFLVRPPLRRPFFACFGLFSLLLTGYESIHVLTGLALGVRAELISLFFGPPMLRICARGIEIRVNCIPLGGCTKFPAHGRDTSAGGGVGFVDLSPAGKLLMHWIAPFSMLLLAACLLGPISAVRTLGHTFATGIFGAIHFNQVAVPAVRHFFDQVLLGRYAHTLGVIAIIFVFLNGFLELAPTVLLLAADRSRSIASIVQIVFTVLTVAMLICLLAWFLATLQVLLPSPVHAR